MNIPPRCGVAWQPSVKLTPRSKHSIAALFVSLDAPTSGASAAETLKSLLPELQAKRITEGKVVK
jgi:hypothetical protein